MESANALRPDGEKIRHLLDRLNWWVAQGGDPQHRPADEKSTGEANAAVSRYKEELDAWGVKYMWEHDRYVLVDVEK